MFKIRRQWTVHCMREPLLTVSARIMLIYKQMSRSVNYLSQSCQQSSIQPIRSWYQELVSWKYSASMECLQAPLRTPSSPDRSRLIPFALDCTRLSPTGACSQASCMQMELGIFIFSSKSNMILLFFTRIKFNKTFNKRKNRALLTFRRLQKHYEILSNNVLRKNITRKQFRVNLVPRVSHLTAPLARPRGR